MDELLINPITRQQIEGFISGKHHAVALIGPGGSGKSGISQYVAKKLLNTDNVIHGVKHVQASTGSIGIDQIRELKKWLQLKSIGGSDIKRIVIIHEAQEMTIESQNALLKILEEPPSDTRFILNVCQSTNIKPTIMSRVQPIRIRPNSISDVLKYFSGKGYDERSINRAFMISGGLAGLCGEILYDKDHSIDASIETAKTILSNSIYNRMIMVNELSKDKDKMKKIISAVKRILKVSFEHNKIKYNDSHSTTRYANQLKTVYKTEEMLNTNVNTKMIVTNLLLNI